MLSLEGGVDQGLAGVFTPDHIMTPLEVEGEVVGHNGRPLVILCELDKAHKVRRGAGCHLVQRLFHPAGGCKASEDIKIHAQQNVKRIEGGVVPGCLITHRDYATTHIKDLLLGAILVARVQL